MPSSGYAQLLALLLSAALTTVPVCGQITTKDPSRGSAGPAYDVVSVKPDNSDAPTIRVQMDQSSYHAINVPLLNLISNAYGIREGLISGLPGWAEAARFDVDAKMTDTSAASLKLLTQDQRQAMLAAILQDRFGLKVHTETKNLPVYDLIVSKGGPKFSQSLAASEGGKSPARPGPGGMMLQDGDMVATAIHLSQLVGTLAGELDRTVLDKTGLAGTYDLHLKWTPATQDAGETQNGESGEPAPDLFTALQEQLGLKLVAAKGPVSIIIVDQVAKPAPN